MFKDTKDFKLGTWIQINNPEIVEIVGESSFDFVIIDMEHGNISEESAANLIRAAEVKKLYPIIRVPENNASTIMKVLDLGAKGVVIPHIETKTDAEKAVKAAKYAPIGDRGSCPCIRAGSHFIEDWSLFSKASNEVTSLILLVEGAEGISNFSEIVAVEGVDGYMIGPFDLSVSLGVPGEVTHPLVEQKLDEVSALAREHGKEIIAVDFSNNESAIIENLDKWIDRGSRILMTGIDKMLITQCIRNTSKIKDKVKGGVKL